LNPVQKGFLKGQTFDLIAVGGELPDECRKAAEALLAPGGAIVVNPSADTYQIEDAERRRANEQLKAWEDRRVAGGQSQAAGPSKAPNQPVVTALAPAGHIGPIGPISPITVVLLNWRRPENMGPILDCLARQTLRPRVMIVDNGAAESGPLQFNSPYGEPAGALRPIEEHPLVSLVMRPSRNLGCMPRWWLAAMADTEFVATLDDDLVLADERVLADALAAQREVCPEGIVGFFGVVYRSDRTYRTSLHLAARAGQDQRVDIVKGRFMLLRRDALERVPLWHPALTPEAAFRADDIYVSLMLSAARRTAAGEPTIRTAGEPLHVLPGALAGRWKEILPQDSRALALQPGHWEIRDRLVRALLADVDRSNRSYKTYQEALK